MGGQIDLKHLENMIAESGMSEIAVSSLDAARGCMLGACIGDAAGAPLEFQEKITRNDALKALTLHGGGVHMVGKGQITDDTELAICLARGLLAGNGKLDIGKIILQYSDWFNSNPFDIGQTIRGALTALREKMDPNHLRQRVKEVNYSSQSNGSLMRITPLCIWISKLSSNVDKITAIREEVSLTHCSPVVSECAICYCLAISSLIQYPGNRTKAYAVAKAYVSMHECSEEFSEWWGIIESSHRISCTEQIGWVKIAFICAFQYLKDPNMNFIKALLDILERGGDTDTNAAIVGGLMGALTGAASLPPQLKDPILAFGVKVGGGISRPKFLLPGNPDKNIVEIIDNLYELAPTHLYVVGGIGQESKYTSEEEKVSREHEKPTHRREKKVVEEAIKGINVKNSWGVENVRNVISYDELFAEYEELKDKYEKVRINKKDIGEVLVQKDVSLFYIRRGIMQHQGADYTQLWNTVFPEERYVLSDHLSPNPNNYTIYDSLHNIYLQATAHDITNELLFHILKVQFESMCLCSTNCPQILQPLSLHFNNKFALVVNENAGSPLPEIWSKGKIDPISGFYQLAVALKRIYKEGFFHGHIKPSLILHKNNDFKISGFGSRKLFNSLVEFLKYKKEDPKTYEFFAPEIIWEMRSGLIGNFAAMDVQKMDVFSLALCVYAMVMGSFPAQIIGLKETKETYNKFIQNISNNLYINKGLLDVAKEAKFRDIIVRCLNSDPKQRPDLDIIINVLE